MGSPGGCPAPDAYPAPCTQELGRWANETLHFVKLTRAFEMQVHEVTQAEWGAQFGGWNPSTFKAGSAHPCGDFCPLEGITWYDAVAYANAKSIASGKSACYTFSQVQCKQGGNPTVGGNWTYCMNAEHSGIESAVVGLNGVATPQECSGYRLPTEAEWEYAIRAGSLTAFHPSLANDGAITQEGSSPLDPNLDKIAWYGGNYPQSQFGTQAVGGKAANAWGLQDMSGNVLEWCWDWYQTYPASSQGDPAVDPVGASTGTDRVVRGGGWPYDARYCRSAYRLYLPLNIRYYALGFRLSRTVWK